MTAPSAPEIQTTGASLLGGEAIPSHWGGNIISGDSNGGIGSSLPHHPQQGRDLRFSTDRRPPFTINPFHLPSHIHDITFSPQDRHLIPRFTIISGHEVHSHFELHTAVASLHSHFHPTIGPPHHGCCILISIHPTPFPPSPSEEEQRQGKEAEDIRETARDNRKYAGKDMNNITVRLKGSIFFIVFMLYSDIIVMFMAMEF